MKISNLALVNISSVIERTSVPKNGSSSSVNVSKSLGMDKAEISTMAINKLKESQKNELSTKFEDIAVYTAYYDDAIKMIQNMVTEKKDAQDLDSCGEFYLMMYHKASLDKDLSI